MRKEISATELHQKLGELLDGVYHNGDRLIVKRANTPLAAIVPIETYEEMLQQRVQAFSVLDRIWEKVPAVSEEEAHTDIEQAIAEARAEKTRKVRILSKTVHATTRQQIRARIRTGRYTLD